VKGVLSRFDTPTRWPRIADGLAALRRGRGGRAFSCETLGCTLSEKVSGDRSGFLSMRVEMLSGPFRLLQMQGWRFFLILNANRRSH
jgi:hypothetical protein